MSDGFDFSELSDFTKELVVLANDTMPKETRKFLGKQGSQLRSQVLKIAKSETKKNTGNYIEGIKRGKIYKYLGDELAVRVYGGSPHSHLIEYGHNQIGHKPGKKDSGVFVPGKYVFKKGYENFKDKFVDNIEQFVDEMLDKGLH
jgi:hypothetical protein